MDARILRTALAVLFVVALSGAKHRTANFTCEAATQQIAVEVCESAERFRRDLAIEWLGRELPKWGQPCPIVVQVGERMGAGGATSFVFDRGEVFGWQMTIQGSFERVLDSVLPHEVTHTIFASHFRQPLPRWADEGACTTVEHPAERNKQQRLLIEFLQTGRGISFSQMFAMKEYPPDVLPLYAQGHSLASFLLAQGGKQKYLQFVADGLESENWSAELNKHYGFRNLGVLQNTWLDWVAQGSPALNQPAVTTVAATSVLPGPGAANTSSASPTAQAAAPVQLAAATPAAASPYPNSWTGKRPRPQPNLVHHDAERSIVPTPAGVSIAAAADHPAPISAGELVPIEFGPGAPVQESAGRPQSPETPRQVILEWSAEPATTLRR